MTATATRYGEHPAGIVWTEGETRTVRAHWLPLPSWLVLDEEPAPALPLPPPPPAVEE